MIVKVQLSDVPWNKVILIYNEDRSIYQEFDAPADLVRKLDLKKYRKVYCEAEVDPKSGMLNIDNRVEEQEW